MLRKLKQQVAQAVNSVNPSEPQHEPLFNESDISSEGFLCPICMQSFSSPDELQIHFQVHSVHQVEKQKLGSSSSFSLPGNDFNESNVVHLELEMKELKSQLQDEKHYSMELKKELNRLHGLIANKTKISEEEIPYLTQQVQMLEAGKALATEQMLEMEKATNGLNRQVEQLKQEKIRLLKKIGELSTSVISKTNEIEEKNKEKALLGDELVRYRQEIQNLEVEIENLLKKLDQRPSEDDVNVLRKELVHAQQLMDAVTQEKEEEIKKDINTIRSLKQDRKRLTCEIEVLKNNIEDFKNTIEKFDNGFKELIGEINTFRIIWEEKAANSAERISDACKKICDLEIIVNEYQRRIIYNGIQNKILNFEDVKSLLEVSQKNGKYKEELRQNNSALEMAMSRTGEISEGGRAENLAVEQIHEEKMAPEETVNGLNEALEFLNISHKNAVSKYEELKNELNELHSNYISEEKNKNELVAMLKEKMKTVEEFNEIIETEHIKLKSVTEKLTLKEERMRQLDNELHAKGTVANRLNEEYSKLEEMVKNMRSELKDVKLAKKQLECDLVEREKSSKENVCQLQEALSICRQEKSMLKKQLENVVQQCSALNEECSTYKDSEIEFLKKINQKELIVKELEEKINNLMAKLEYEKQNRDESIKDVQCKLNQMQQDNITVLNAKERVTFLFFKVQEIATQLEMISELNEELYAKEKHLSDVLQEMENVRNKLSSKEEERSTLENEVLKLNKQNSELRKEMDDLEKCILQLKNDFEKETNLLKNDLEKCKKDKEESVLKLHVQLETEKRRLKEASKDIEEKNENLKRIEGNLNELKIVQKDLEKRKTEWLQEKRALQERCLTAESDLEFERERAVMNKRNFDDVQTAIRELGQVNQNLQMDFAKQVSRKWLEDSEAINCHACDKPFTLTNRKHHCRQCGQIFCASCSSFTAKIASSRSSVRVCNACHEEIMHR